MRDFYTPDNDDFDATELLAERQARRYYQRQLLNHPDPRDPDYPEPPETTEGEDK